MRRVAPAPGAEELLEHVHHDLVRLDALASAAQARIDDVVAGTDDDARRALDRLNVLVALVAHEVEGALDRLAVNIQRLTESQRRPARRRS